MKECKKVSRTLVNWYYHVSTFQIELAHVVSLLQQFSQHWNSLYFEVSTLNVLIQIGAIQNWASFVGFLNRKKLWEIIFGLGRRYFGYFQAHKLLHCIVHCRLFYFGKFHWSVTPRMRYLVDERGLDKEWWVGDIFSCWLILWSIDQFSVEWILWRILWDGRIDPARKDICCFRVSI